MKKNLSSIGILLFGMLTAGATHAGASQILVNPGFETGAFAPWVSGGGTITTAEAHTGIYSFAGFSSDYVSQSFAPVATSDVAEVSFWVKRQGGPFDLVIFSYDDATTSQTLVNDIGASGWRFFNVTAALTPGKNLSEILVYGTSSGPAYLDDFKIETNVNAAVPEPASLTLLGLGLVGRRFFRRKTTR